MPHYFYYGFDIYYIILILPALIISLVAQFKVKSTFSKYSNMHSATRLTGADAAKKVLSEGFRVHCGRDENCWYGRK